MFKIKELIGESAGQIDVKRTALFLAFVAVAGAMFYGPFREVMQAALRSDYYSHIVLIPFVSAYLLFIRRKEIFADIGYAFVPGAAVAGVGVLLYGIARLVPLGLNKNDFSALVTPAALFFVVGAFILLFGLQAFRAARFALLFLLFMVPVPTALMDGIIRILQVGTTEFVALLFAIAPVPVLRDGFVFHLPNISIEVAPQCSGIRSSMALVITSVLAGHMFLRTGWKKWVLVLAVIPVTMFKNGIRIVTLSLLAVYVDTRILTNSTLHTDGGILFFVLALLLMAPILFLLRRSEKGPGTRG
jgi:exosortase